MFESSVVTFSCFSDYFRFFPLVIFIINAVVADWHVVFPVGKKISGAEIWSKLIAGALLF